MCTVIIRVPEEPREATRIIAVRDEDPARPWDELGQWWPDTDPGVLGVRDIRAGGAWLATQPAAGRLVVLLNVGPPTAPRPGLTSRGQVVLDAASNRTPPTSRQTAPYALLVADGNNASLEISDGESVRHEGLPPGVHMLVNSPVVNDFSVARVERWLPRFRQEVPAPDAENWFGPWLGIMQDSGELPATNDAAIIRDNTPHGIGTFSLLMVTATITRDHVEADYVEFDKPGDWDSRISHLPGQ